MLTVGSEKAFQKNCAKNNEHFAKIMILRYANQM